LFINEFGNTAFVFKEDDVVCAYLFGFYSQTQPAAYVHLIAVRNNYNRLGLGRKLYERFIECAREKHCLKTKAITKPTNLESIEFIRG
jgi:GNAT superfamily N-acetyltransferase